MKYLNYRVFFLIERLFLKWLYRVKVFCFYFLKMNSIEYGKYVNYF